MKLPFLFFLISIVTINLISASTCPTGVGYCNPNLPFINPTQAVTTTNYSSINVNNSQYLQGYVPDDFWKSYEDQSGLTGKKEGDFVFYDTSSTQSISHNDRLLYDSSGYSYIDWENKKIQSDGNLNIDWENRYLYASDGTTVMLRWDSTQGLYGGSGPAGFVDLINGKLISYTGSATDSLDYVNRGLYESSGNVAYNWELGLIGYGGVLGIDLVNRYLYANDGTTLVSQWADGTLKDGSGNPYLTSSSWVGTATNDLDMVNYNIFFRDGSSNPSTRLNNSGLFLEDENVVLIKSTNDNLRDPAPSLEISSTDSFNENGVDVPFSVGDITLRGGNGGDGGDVYDCSIGGDIYLTSGNGGNAINLNYGGYGKDGSNIEFSVGSGGNSYSDIGITGAGANAGNFIFNLNDGGNTDFGSRGSSSTFSIIGSTYPDKNMFETDVTYNSIGKSFYINNVGDTKIKSGSKLYIGDTIPSSAYFTFNGSNLIVIADTSASQNYAYLDGNYRFINNVIVEKNVTINKNLFVNGNLNQTGGNATINNVYGFVYNYSDVGYSVTPSASGVFQNFSGFYNNGDSPYMNGMRLITGTPATGGDKIQVQFNGYYAIDFDSTTDATAGGIYTFGIANNSAVLTKGRCFTEYEGDGRIQSNSINCMKRLKAGDNLSLMFKDDANPVKAVTIYKVGIRVIRVGD